MKNNNILQTNQDFINTELAKFNIADHEISKWKSDFMTLQVNGVNDKEGYEVVKRSRIFIRDRRTEIGKKAKEVRDVAIKFQKTVIEEEKRLVGELTLIENYLQEQQDKIDAEKERIKLEKEQQAQQRLQQRVNDLITKGMKFDGDAYTLNHLRYTALQLKLADDFTYAHFFKKVENEYELERLRLLAEEEKKKKEAEKFKLLQEAQKEELEKIAKEKAEIEAMLKKQREDEEKLANERLKMERQKQLMAEQVITNRKAQLFGLGMSLSINGFVFDTVKVPLDLVTDVTDEIWIKNYESINRDVQIAKKGIEEKRLLEIEVEKQKAVQKALELVKEQELEKIKELEEKKQKSLKLEALAPDAKKFDIFMDMLAALQCPEFSTDEYKSVCIEINETLKKCVNYLKSKKPTNQ